MMITKIKTCMEGSRLTRMRVTALIVAIAVFCAGTAFASTDDSFTVSIYDAGEVITVQTKEEDPYTIVEQANIELLDRDKLYTEKFKVGETSSIYVCRASNVKFIDAEGNEKTLFFAGTVKELALEQGIRLGEKYIANYDGDTIVTQNMEVIIYSANGVTIKVDDELKNVFSTAETVEDLLSEQEIVLDENDEVVPSLETAVYDGMYIEVLRVEYATREATEVIPYETITKYTNRLRFGKEVVKSEGSDGLKTVVYEDKYVNGELAVSTVLEETILEEAVDHLVWIGVYGEDPSVEFTTGNSIVEKNGKPISELLMPEEYVIGENNVPLEYQYTITGRASAYCLPGSVTSTGKKVRPGYIAVNPEQIPYGTKMWVVSDEGIVYGYSIAADTGGFAEKGYFTLDLYMNTIEQCTQWGVRHVTIYIL